VAQWPAFFAPNGMDSANYETLFAVCALSFPSKPTISNPEEIVKWQCLPMM
jgi:hypothetical protein